MQYCTFNVAGFLFGIEVDQVQEVIRTQNMTPVPMSPAVVEGLINLRGQIVTAIDLRKRLSLPERPEGLRPMNVVVRMRDGAVSLLVDQIGEVIDVSEDTFEAPPSTLADNVMDLIKGAYKLDGQLLLLLDTAHVVAVASV